MRLLYLWFVVVLLPGPGGQARETLPRPRMAVLEFATEEDLAWLGAGFAATLAARLDLLPGLRVIDPFKVQRTARQEGTVPLQEDSVQSLGHTLAVDFVITGQILQEEESLTVTAWLVRVPTGRRQREKTLTGTRDDLFAMQLQLLTAWRRTLRLRLSPEEETRVATYLPTDSLRAFEFFGQGLVRYDPDRPREALNIWQQAVEFDPHFVLAREAQGRAAYRYQELLYQQALEQYRQALAQDPGNARLHYLLGLAYYNRGDHQNARHEWQEATRLKPNYVEAQYQLGFLALTRLKRPQEAIQAFNALLEIEPTHVRALNNLGVALWETGAREQALRAWQEVLRQDPENPFAQENLRRFGR